VHRDRRPRPRRPRDGRQLLVPQGRGECGRAPRGLDAGLIGLGASGRRASPSGRTVALTPRRARSGGRPLSNLERARTARMQPHRRLACRSARRASPPCGASRSACAVACSAISDQRARLRAGDQRAILSVAAVTRSPRGPRATQGLCRMLAQLAARQAQHHQRRVQCCAPPARWRGPAPHPRMLLLYSAPCGFTIAQPRTRRARRTRSRRADSGGSRTPTTSPGGGHLDAPPPEPSGVRIARVRPDLAMPLAFAASTARCIMTASPAW
jgi:hypothetical protein